MFKWKDIKDNTILKKIVHHHSLHCHLFLTQPASLTYSIPFLTFSCLFPLPNFTLSFPTFPCLPFPLPVSLIYLPSPSLTYLHPPLLYFSLPDSLIYLPSPSLPLSPTYLPLPPFLTYLPLPVSLNLPSFPFHTPFPRLPTPFPSLPSPTSFPHLPFTLPFPYPSPSSFPTLLFLLPNPPPPLPHPLSILCLPRTSFVFELSLNQTTFINITTTIQRDTFSSSECTCLVNNGEAWAIKMTNEWKYEKRNIASMRIREAW